MSTRPCPGSPTSCLGLLRTPLAHWGKDYSYRGVWCPMLWVESWGPASQVPHALGASLSPRHRCVLSQTLWFDLQQRLSDEEGTNMVRPSPPFSSDLFLQPSEERCSSTSLATLRCSPLPKGYGEPRLQDPDKKAFGLAQSKHLAHSVIRLCTVSERQPTGHCLCLLVGLSEPS